MEATFSEYLLQAGLMGTVMVMRFVLTVIAAIGLGYGLVRILTKVLDRVKGEKS